MWTRCADVGDEAGMADPGRVGVVEGGDLGLNLAQVVAVAVPVVAESGQLVEEGAASTQ